ncbi:MAG: glutamate mutase L [Chloroflexota bacterium]|nr:glutamate mutase L [Chloroflexota bacterium]
MAAEQHIGSILLADCGTVMTKVVLLDQVAGQYRFIAQGEAPSTAEYPWSDMASGIRHAVEQISKVTDRRFFDANGDLISPELDRQGVDVFAATVSASQPLQVVLSGLVRDLSVASAERAAAGTYSLVKAVLAGDSRGGGWSDEDRVRVIRDAAPDVICIAGGIEGGAVTPVLELVEASALACSLIEPELRPRLLYAGNSRLRRQVVDIVGERAELCVTDNVRPTLAEENLLGAQAELDALYLQDKMEQLPGIDTVSGWSPAPLTPTARAFGRLVQYLWHLGDSSRGVLGVDVGAANTTVAAAFDGRLSLTVRGDLGIAFGGKQLLQKQGADTITRWLPEPMSDSEVHGLLINKEMRPISIPQEPRELWLEQALAREALRTTLQVARPGWKPGVAQSYPHLMPLCDTIVVSGGVLAHAPHPGQAALIVLDGLEPVGVSTLVLDAHGLAPALGNVAAVKPLAAAEALDGGGLVNLATVVTPVGHARRGDVILKVRVAYDDGSRFSVDVCYGDLEILPLAPGQQAVLELRPLRHFDVGLGGPGKAGKRRVSGGLAGLIIDARGRPLRFPSDPKQCQAQMRQWLWDAGG